MKRLYRSKREAMLGGVAAGLADYFEVDVTLIRLAWVLLAFTSVGFVGYLIAWLIIPEEPIGVPPVRGGEDPGEEDDDGSAYDGEVVDGGGPPSATASRSLGVKPVGWLMLIVGLYLLLAAITPWHHILLSSRLVLPLLLVGFGIYIILRRR